MNKSKRTKRIIIITLVSIFVLYFTICFALNLFEPVYYNAPDLSKIDYCFDVYNNFSYDKNNTFYIKQINFFDVASTADIRLKYIKNTAILVAENNVTYSDVEDIADEYNAEISGYIADADFYQFTFSDLSYDNLTNICSDIQSRNEIAAAIPDFFEETPLHEASSDDYNLDNYDLNEYYYYDMININSIWNAKNDFSDIKIGMIDSPVDSDRLNIAEKGYSDSYAENNTHGTQVAGILSSSDTSTAGVCPNAQIYSYSGLNCSLSYWVASICNMIINDGVKAVNISMGYNDYIPISATLGCESAQKYIADENLFFESFLSKIIDNGYEFTICVAAGNDSNKAAYKVNSDYFGYGDKKILKKLDIFNIFEKKVEVCDAEYGLFLTNIQDEKVREHIIIVASCGKARNLSSFSNAGDKVDIAAPGEYIVCLFPDENANTVSGTSMSTPFVTAAAAYIYTENPDITAKQVKNILINSSHTTTSNSSFSYPVLDYSEITK